MTTKYIITGMSCGGCVGGVKKALENVPEVEKAEVQLAVPQAEVTLREPVSTEKLQAVLGHYRIQEFKKAV